MYYRKKPVIVEAIQFGPIGNGARIIAWASPNIARLTNKGLEINTFEGTMLANRNDWIIKGVRGEFYPCKPDVFELSYEPVPEAGDKDD